MRRPGGLWRHRDFLWRPGGRVSERRHGHRRRAEDCQDPELRTLHHEYTAEELSWVAATAEWKEYIERNALKQTFLSGPDFVKFLEKDDAYHLMLMKEAGFAK